MPRQSVPFFALNRGEVSASALARVDIEKMRLAASYQVNMQPLAQGPATLRPGTAYLGSTYNDSAAKFIEFVYAVDDTALIELTDQKMRVWVNDALLTRVSVGSSIQALTAWTAVTSPNATISQPSYLRIQGVAQGCRSYAYGAITVPVGDTAKEHGLRIVVSSGPVIFKIGTSIDGEQVFSSTLLGEGTHSISFTPGATTVYAQIESRDYLIRQVDSVSIEPAGVREIPAPWVAADLSSIQFDQSNDVVYVAHKNYQQRKIERRADNSWSIVFYESDDGPFPVAAGDPSFVLTVSDIEADISITSNKALFRSSDVGRLMRLFHSTQNVKVLLSADDTYSNPIRVSGSTASERTVYYQTSEVWVGTITIQRTFDVKGESDWADYLSFSVNTTSSFNDGLTNVIVWYRIGFKPTTLPGPVVTPGYTSGKALCSLSNNGGGGAGIARITGFTSSTSVTAETLVGFKSKAPTNNWRFSEWGSDVGWPSAVALHEGRLWWGGLGKVWGSVSDDYESFDFEAEGDAAPISRTIGQGPIANIRWILALSRLLIGTDAGVISARSNSFDEPLTPTVFNLKKSITQGVKAIRPVAIDGKGVFVEKSGRRIYGMVFSSQDFDYKPLDFTRLNTDIGVPGFVDLAVQRQIDTHIRLPLGDGLMANFLYDEDDEVEAWWRIETDGDIENVMVLPGTLEDRVYVVVKRTINGNTKRYLEKFARLDECSGGSVSKLADCHVIYSGASTTTITGLSHLEGKAVVVWANGAEMGFDSSNPSTIATYTVTGGQITVPTAVTSAVIGLPYTGKFISTKLAYAAAGGTALNRVKRINNIGLILQNTHYQGVRFGHWHDDPAESVLRSLPLVERGKATPAGTIWSKYDQQVIPFPGQWDTDSRVQIEMRAPRPATVLGLTLDISTQG